MTTRHTLLTIAALAMSGTFAAASPLDQIRAEAKKTQTEAKEISTLLRAKSPDFDRVNTKMEALEQHAAAVRGLMAELETSHTVLNDRQRKELERMKAAAQVLDIFVQHKREMLAGSDAVRQRNMLRATADGISARAEIVQQSATRMGS